MRGEYKHFKDLSPWVHFSYHWFYHHILKFFNTFEPKVSVDNEDLSCFVLIYVLCLCSELESEISTSLNWTDVCKWTPKITRQFNVNEREKPSRIPMMFHCVVPKSLFVEFLTKKSVKISIQRPTDMWHALFVIEFVFLWSVSNTSLTTYVKK